MSGQAPLARCDEDGEATEPMLAVPAALMHAVFEELRSSGCMARHWHLEGRCGSRISRLVADGGGGEEDGPHPARLTIPILESAASAIRDMDLLSGRCPGAFQPPTAILNLLRTGDIVLRRLPVTPARLPKVGESDFCPARLPNDSASISKP